MNVILIDWREAVVLPNYLTAVENVKTCGSKIASFIIKNRLNPRLIHCIGHSLGTKKQFLIIVVPYRLANNPLIIFTINKFT